MTHRYDLTNPAIKKIVLRTHREATQAITAENKRAFYKNTRRKKSHEAGTSFNHTSAQRAEVSLALGMPHLIKTKSLVHRFDAAIEMRIATAIGAYFQMRLDNELAMLQRGTWEEVRIQEGKR